MKMIKGKNHSTLLIVATIFFLTLAVAACNTGVEDSSLSLVDENGNHPAGWTEAHGTYATPDGNSCNSCHGSDLNGGISNVSCSSASYNGQSCHAGGPAFHPDKWLDKQAQEFHGLTYQADQTACEQCHDPNDSQIPPGYNCLECHFNEDGTQRVPTGSGYAHGDSGTSHTQFQGSADGDVCINCHDVNISFGYEPTCHNCHGDADHEVPFLDHYQVVPTQSDFNDNCDQCHRIAEPQPDPSARQCDDCHTSGSPYDPPDCSSCHGNPPNTGEHEKHDEEGFACNTCHTGGGTGTGLDHGYDDFVNLLEPAGEDINFTTGTNVTCVNDCHGEFHDNEDW